MASNCNMILLAWCSRQPQETRENGTCGAKPQISARQVLGDKAAESKSASRASDEVLEPGAGGSIHTKRGAGHCFRALRHLHVLGCTSTFRFLKPQQRLRKGILVREDMTCKAPEPQGHSQPSREISVGRSPVTRENLSLEAHIGR